MMNEMIRNVQRSNIASPQVKHSYYHEKESSKEGNKEGNKKTSISKLEIGSLGQDENKFSSCSSLPIISKLEIASFASNENKFSLEDSLAITVFLKNPVL